MHCHMHLTTHHGGLGPRLLTMVTPGGSFAFYLVLFLKCLNFSKKHILFFIIRKKQIKKRTRTLEADYTNYGFLWTHL